jgi:large subunit ribosomal protein L24
MKIRKGDTVVVLKGDDRGKVGRVISVNEDKKQIVVQRVRLVKRHQKPGRRQTGITSGIVEKEGPINVSNVALVDPKTNKPTRSRMKLATQAENKTGARRSKVRIAASGVEIERPVTKS